MRYKDENKEVEKQLWDSYVETKYNDNLNKLIELYYPLVEKYKKLHIRRYGIAENLHIDVHDKCVDALYKSIQTFDTDCENTFETYYSNKSNGEILHLFRDVKKLPILFEDNEELNIQDYNLNYDFSIETTSLLEKCLTEEEIEIVKLKYVDGFSIKEIGKIIGMNYDNIYSKHQDILFKLKNKMKNEVR